jgi:hypothetical protein
VLEDAKRLAGALSADDKRKLDEYMYGVRDIETRIQKTERTNAVNPTIEKPIASVPENYDEHTSIMFDLMTAAFQTDSTRIVTFLMAIEQSNRAYREIGIPDSHHGLTHHGGDKEKIEKCIKINQYQVQQLAYFIDKMKATKGRRRHAVRPHHGDLRQRPGRGTRSRQSPDDSDGPRQRPVYAGQARHASERDAASRTCTWR